MEVEIGRKITKSCIVTAVTAILWCIRFAMGLEKFREATGTVKAVRKPTLKRHLPICMVCLPFVCFDILFIAFLSTYVDGPWRRCTNINILAYREQR